MNLINELRMLAEDLHVNGYNRYSAAMSKAADELAKWEAVFGHLGGTPDECGNAIIAARDELEERTRRLESALHRISLCSQNSTSSRRECGRIARAALEESTSTRLPEKLCYDSRLEIPIDYVDGWNAAVDMMRGKSPSWHCPDCCIAFPFGAPKACPHDDARCNKLLADAKESA